MTAEKTRGEALRQELHAYIDVMPERYLLALKPILALLAELSHATKPASPENGQA